MLQSKHNLFELCLQRYQKFQAAALVDFLRQPGCARERLKTALELLIRLDLEGPIKKGCMAVNTAAELSTTDKAAVRLVRDIFDRTESAFAQLVEEGQSRGEFRRDIDAHSLASLLFNTVVGLRIAGLVADTPEVPSAGPVAYTTAKTALTALSKSLAEEFGPQGVRVNTVSPGAVCTSLWEGKDRFGSSVAAAFGVEHEAFLSEIPARFQMTTGRITEAEEVANLIVAPFVIALAIVSALAIRL